MVNNHSFKTPIGVTLSFTVLMALDPTSKSLQEHSLSLPSSSLQSPPVPTATSSQLCTKNLTGRNLTFLQAIGAGHVSNILAMIGSALVEGKRLRTVQAQNLTTQPNAVAPAPVMATIMGIGEGLYFPAEVALYYQEFPGKLRSTSTSMTSLHIAAGYYLISAFTDLVGRLSSLLKNDINHGRVHKACWILLVIAVLKYGYFSLICLDIKVQDHPDPQLDDKTSVVAPDH
ncbi:hypothetical protein Cgig2_014017 [Carnegiea gigantea]|uniref:Uncharacterized protein n=1 Tax=Carnegiea gigantea TaxID=171969 RepID=A0A9Q1QT13_9CARY|nr:hypothetical protein Cgig2_014017 [Carnegiea gigantea]